MKEQNFLHIIESIIGTKYIGDDCAYLKDLGIVVTQDSFVEGIHFRRDWFSAKEIGYKSLAVNISDILASGAFPKYVTIAISLPNDIDENFIKDFYEGAKEVLCGAEIIGGDITGSVDKIVISITAIGMDTNRKISSRKNAKSGFVIITKGNHGSSSLGLKELINNGKNYELIQIHKKPVLEEDFSISIAKNIEEDYAMMDSSDGLADALFKIAESSNVKIIVDYSKVPHLDCATKEDVLFGGEDYKLVAAVPKEFSKNIKGAVIIGEVVDYDGIRLKIDDDEYNNYENLNVYNHFK